ncbi:hypothetical protein ISP15_03185 [Dyella jejuensis]|uniref:Uncharacterized protein n=1 Tax=Dyella jejuensis TaxID=1432009 RepID=A0ABW8JE92_9GAMM
MIEQLHEGYRRGGKCKREAFCAVRSRYPDLPGHVITRFARRQGWLVKSPASVSPRRRWTAAEQAHFAAMAEQQPVAKMAHALGRSRKAIRWRLGAQGLSAKVEGLWSARRLTRTLHVGRITLRRWIAEHAVRVRDAHITGTSLLAYRARDSYVNEGVARDGTASITIQPDQCYCWKEAAQLLGHRIEGVRQGVARGTLKLVDTLVSDQALQRFCQHYSLGRLDRSRIDPGIHRWLVCEYGLPN